MGDKFHLNFQQIFTILFPKDQTITIKTNKTLESELL